MNVSYAFTGYSLHSYRRPIIVGLSIYAIQVRVAQFYGLSVADLTSDRRPRSITRPRQIAMFLCRELTKHSLPKIGRQFGDRDHTTVIHALKQVKRLCADFPEIAREVRLLTADLKEFA